MNERSLWNCAHAVFRQRLKLPFEWLYRGELAGDYCADILVEGKLLIELKCVDSLSNEHIAQTLNYLKATDRHIALLVNFKHPKVEWKRIVHNF